MCINLNLLTFPYFYNLFSALLTLSANSSMVAFVFYNLDTKALLLVGFVFAALIIFLCLNALGLGTVSLLIMI